MRLRGAPRENGLLGLLDGPWVLLRRQEEAPVLIQTREVLIRPEGIASKSPTRRIETRRQKRPREGGLQNSDDAPPGQGLASEPRHLPATCGISGESGPPAEARSGRLGPTNHAAPGVRLKPGLAGQWYRPSTPVDQCDVHRWATRR